MCNRCWVCRRIGSTETRCSRPETSTDAKQLLPGVTLAVQALDSQLQALRPAQISNEMVVVETSLGLTLSSIPISLVASGINSSGQAACWSSGDVIVGCNGRIVQTKADLLRAMRFSDNQSVTLDVVSSQCVSSKENLPADWVRKEMAGKRIVYKNNRTKHITWLHPQLHSKPVLPLLVSLATYTSGNYYFYCR